MKSRLLWILPLTIVITSTGLILVQTRWLNIAMDTKREQFEQTAVLALERVVHRIDDLETVVRVIEEQSPYSSSLRKQDIHQTFKQGIIDQTRSGFRSKLVSQEMFTISSVDSVHLPSLTHRLFDTLSLSRLPAQLSYRSDGGSQISLKFNDMRHDMQTVFVENVVDRHIRIDLPFEQRLLQAELDSIINEEFARKGITAHYEYCVVSARDSMVYRSEHYSRDYKGVKYSNVLFPNDFMSQRYFLHLYFPHSKHYLVRSLGLIVGISIFFVILIISVFTATVIIIYRQKRLSDMKADFVSNMTHELKTPIATISLAAQLLNNPDVPAERKNYTQLGNIIADESKRLGLQVEKVLQMSIFERGNMNLKFKEIDLHSIISKVAMHVNLQVQARHGALVLELNATDHHLTADEVHITNVVNNLLDNALKYSPSVPMITITTSSSRTGIQFAVADQGLGISSEHQKKIFEQFYRVPTGNVHNVKGFGLGLSYVQKIVEAHDGKIWVESELNNGSTFFVYLPFDTPMLEKPKNTPQNE